MKEFLVINRGVRILVPETAIQYFLYKEKYCEMHLYDGTVHLFDRTINELELTMPDFIRVHRNCLVRRAEIVAVRSSKFSDNREYEATLDSGGRIVVPISRRRYKEIRAYVGTRAFKFPFDQVEA